MNKKMINMRIIRRISFYYEALLKMEIDDEAYVSSKKIEEITGISGNQVRQDLYFLGVAIGKQKKGYQVKRLVAELKKILSIQKGAKVIVVGAGRMGQALAEYKIFRQRNIQIVALFDIKPEIVGSITDSRVAPKPILHVDQLSTFLAENPDVSIALLTVPEDAAQKTLEELLKLGIRGIVNFAPRVLKLPAEAKNVFLVNDCIGISMYKIIYQLHHSRK